MTPFRHLEEAAAVAVELGLDDHARAAGELKERIERRLGFAGDVYVLGLVGGTGVGKSSVLNALAGREVSPARALRPTTEQPVAWVAEESKESLRPLLDWLGVDRVVGHGRSGLDGVAVLDLPDVDSVRIEHRATVDSLLPRIDAVAWVVDPEKYDDERLHEYLRVLAPHAERMRFIFNKADRLRPGDQELLVNDFARRLAADGIEGARIDVVSALDGTGVDELRKSLGEEAEGKALVVAKLATDADTEMAAIARAAGLEPGTGEAPLIPDRTRETATKSAVDGALALVDPVGVSRQMEEAVLHRARGQGGSLLARLVTLISFLSGRKKRKADPAAYLLDWRRRGSLGHVLNPVRSALVEAAAGVPAATRPRILQRLGAADLEAEVARALDRSTRLAANQVDVPSSWLWPVVGFFQLIAGGVLLIGLAWYLVAVFGPVSFELGSIDVPLLGPVPSPLVLVVVSLVASLLLGLILTLHARWVGRRSGRRVRKVVAEAVEQAVVTAGFGGLDAVEEARRRLFALSPFSPKVTLHPDASRRRWRP